MDDANQVQLAVMPVEGQAVRLPRITTRRLMLAVAGVALVLPIVREAIRLWASLPGQPWHSLLQVGEHVTTAGVVQLEPPDGSGPLASGTRCVVVHEPAWDDDSCYPRRKIVVRVAEGDRVGEVLDVPRDQLRPL